MISTIRRMLTCHWSARRIQRYLDADPAAQLAPKEVRRLEAHLAICEKCTGLEREHQRLHWALTRWSGRQLPTSDAIARMHAVVERLVEPES